MDKITIEVSDLSKVSDGYHTIAELYDHRCVLFLALAINNPAISYWLPEHYEGWDLIVMGTSAGQISYHIPTKFRRCTERLRQATSDEHVFDGHTSQDVIDRLTKWCAP